MPYAVENRNIDDTDMVSSSCDETRRQVRDTETPPRYGWTEGNKIPPVDQTEQYLIQKEHMQTAIVFLKWAAEYRKHVASAAGFKITSDIS